jgi:transposase
MQCLFDSVAGVDVHKEKLNIATLVKNAVGKIDKTSWECKTFTEDLEVAGNKLIAMGIKYVAMESTGIYWRPVYNVWSKLGLIITLANASHVKNVPGRKTDVLDSEWLAKLHQMGLIRGSYLPEENFQELRALTRHRRNLIEDLTKVKNRVQKILEDGNIKLSCVLSDVFGVAGLAIIKALASGEIDPDHLTEQVKTNVKRPKEEIKKSLTNTFKSYHLFLIKELYIQYLSINNLLDSINLQIDENMRPHESLIKKLDAVPGIDVHTAQDIIAEATTKMENFKDDKTFAAWTGVAPGNNESARKKKDQNVVTETRILQKH